MTDTEPSNRRQSVAVVGGGPAGLAAAELLAGHADVYLFEAKPSLGRKFLLAGRSGLNLSRDEDLTTFLDHFGDARAFLEPVLRNFPPEAVRAWALGLGVETFVGSSRRIYPRMMKASPLLRAWIARLNDLGVRIRTRHVWQGWTRDGALCFDTPDGPREFAAVATVLALGGGSWPRLGSTGSWTALLANRGIVIQPLRPSNCGFDVAWSAGFRERFAGQPVQSVGLTCGRLTLRGEFVVTGTGVEGNTIYALSPHLREQIDAEGAVQLKIDLAPDRRVDRLVRDLSRLRGKSSLANHLRKSAGLTGVKTALLREQLDAATLADPQLLAVSIKSLSLTLEGARPIDEAISSAGGIAFEELNTQFMLSKAPGVFAAGEMLDWEAPTGGYLLNTCFATGRAAGLGALDWIRRH